VEEQLKVERYSETKYKMSCCSLELYCRQIEDEEVTEETQGRYVAGKLVRMRE